MTTRFVADASVGVAWCNPAQASPETDDLLDQVAAGRRVVVPHMWQFEVANALVVLLRRKKFSRAEFGEALSRLEQVAVAFDIDTDPHAHRHATALAVTHDLSVYDATYLELASRQRLDLASRDDALNRAARRAGVNLLLTYSR